MFEEEYAEHATAIWHLSDVASVAAPDPLLDATYDGALGEPGGPAMGTESGLTGKIKDVLS